MGITNQYLKVKESRKSPGGVDVDFMIDSGAVYSLVPSKILKKLGIESYRQVSFSLADGSKISRKVGEAFFEMNGEGATAPVIFGEKGDEPLLGATTLEAMGLILNPFTRTLHPMRMLLGGIKPLK